MTKMQIKKLIIKYCKNGERMRQNYNKYGSPTQQQQVTDEKLWNEIKDELKLDDDLAVGYIKSNYPLLLPNI